MNSKQLICGLLGLGVAFSALPAMAHHATSTFYTEEVIQLTGEIVEIVWANPHGIIVFQDEDGEYYAGEMGSILSLANQGLGSADLPVGMTITVDALPARNGSNRVHINAISSNGEAVYGSPDV